MFRLYLAILLLGAHLAGAAELTVGPGKMYAKPSQAAAAAQDGDTITIDAGTYSGDVCAWTRNNLTIRGNGGFAHLAAAGANYGGKGTWIITGANTTIESIEFSGASCPDHNGAGIRQEGPGLTVRNCRFHDNENGILAADHATSDILIERSEFGYNGYGDGYTHNLYINHVRSLTFRYNYSHHAKIGHNLKSRALANYVIGNRIMDEASGTSSYVVDFPNGGLTFLIGNLIEQGPMSANRSQIVRYAEEGGTSPIQRLYVINNTFVNDHANSCTFLDIAAGTTVARVENNIFLGTGTAIAGTPTSNLHNLITTTDPLVGRSTYDYRLKAGAAAIDAAANPGSGDGYVLLPTTQYLHPNNFQARTTTGTAPDIGAYEYAGGTPTNHAPVANAQSVSVIEDTAKAITLSASDADADPLSYAIVANPAHGTLSGSGATRTYTPAANYAGSDSFTFKANDGAADSNIATVSITVSPVNDVPVANAQTLTTTQNTAKAITLSASDADGNTLSYAIVTGLAHGTLSGSGTARTYTPAANYTGSDSFTFKANDGTVDSNIATVSITVNSVNHAPVANAQSVNAVEDTAQAITLSASDADADPLTYAIVANPAHGTLSGSGATRTYTPAANYTGNDSFTFRVNDGSANSNVATIAIAISPVNDAPLAAAQSLTTAQNTAKVITLSASDVDGNTLSYTIIAGPAHGTLSGSNAIRTYTPTANYSGADSFTFKANDGTVDSNTATVAIQVTAPASGGGAGGRGGAGGSGGCGSGVAILLLGLVFLLGLRPLRRSA